VLAPAPTIRFHLSVTKPLLEVRAPKPPITTSQSEAGKFAPREEPVNRAAVTVQVFRDLLDHHDFRAGLL